MEDIQEHLNGIVLAATKAVMKAPDLETFHTDTAALYSFLGSYFAERSEEQQQAKAIAITQKDVQVALEKVIRPNIETAGAVISRQNENQDMAKLFSTNEGPYMSQKVLKEKLAAVKISVAAFAEVVEVCRFLDHLQGNATPFGTVNLLHFTAIFVSLCATDTLFELIELLWCVGLTEPTRLKMFHLWGLVDSANRSALEHLINMMLDHPGLTVPLLLELYPEIRYIHTAKFQMPGSNASGSTTAGEGPTEIVYSPDDEATPNNKTDSVPSAVAISSAGGRQTTGRDDTTRDAGGGDGDEEGTDDEDEMEPEDRGFWTALVS